MYMKELQAYSYLVLLNSDTLLNCAHYYSTVIYIIYIKINKAVVMFLLVMTTNTWTLYNVNVIWKIVRRKYLNIT